MDKYKTSFSLPAVLSRDDSVRLVQLAMRYESDIYIQFERYCANAKSMLGVISIPLKAGKEVELRATGRDANEAITELSRFLQQRGNP